MSFRKLRNAAAPPGERVRSGAPQVDVLDEKHTGATPHARRRGGGHAIAVLATRQQGVVSRRQLRRLGLSEWEIHVRIADGQLLPLFPGVFAFGRSDVGRCGLMQAAVLACGDGAVVSHGSAAELLGLWDRRPAAVHVISPGSRGRRLRGIRWHRGQRLEPDEVTTHRGVPCTGVARTLVDMAGSHGEKTLRRLVEQAAVLRLLDTAAIDRTLTRGRRRGAPTLRRLLAPWRRTEDRRPFLRSRMEARLLAALVEAGLPSPRCNAVLQVDGRSLEVDLLWERQRLIVETDGEETHGTRAAFQRDRWRDQLLTAAGYRTARVTWVQLETEPVATIARIRRMLDPPRRRLPVRHT